MPRKLIIDADPGIGDALAIALAALDPNIDLIGVTASSGCVSGMVATQNIFTVMESVDPDKHPRLGASTAPRPTFRQGGVEPPGFLDPLRLNGNYGLGTAEIPIAQLHNQRESAKLLIDQYGAVEAGVHAAQRADALLEQGEMDGRRVWLRILDAVKELSDTTPPGVIH